MVGTIWDLCLGWLYLLSHMVCPEDAKNQEEEKRIWLMYILWVAQQLLLQPWSHENATCLMLALFSYIHLLACFSTLSHLLPQLHSFWERGFLVFFCLKPNHHALMEIISILVEKTFQNHGKLQSELHYSHKKWGIPPPWASLICFKIFFDFTRISIVYIQYWIDEKGNFKKYFKR